MQGSFSRDSAWITAVSSMRLLVGGGLSAGELPAVGAVHQNRAPAAGARIAGAGAVGVDW